MAEKPFLIITLRRTGGTTLASLMASMSSHETTMYEPFNSYRIFGQITLEFKETWNFSTLDASVANALMDTPNLKHCIDVIPFEITSSVVEEANRRGYHIIVLTRRNEVHRLASLFLAKATGSWKAQDAAEIYPKIISGEITPQPINLKFVKRRIKDDIERINLLHSMLNDRQIGYQHICYEDFYADESAMDMTLRNIAQRLNIDQLANALIVPRKFDTTSQRSKDIGPYIENYDSMLTLLNKRCVQKESI